MKPFLRDEAKGSEHADPAVFQLRFAVPPDRGLVRVGESKRIEIASWRKRTWQTVTEILQPSSAFGKHIDGGAQGGARLRCRYLMNHLLNVRSLDISLLPGACYGIPSSRCKRRDHARIDAVRGSPMEKGKRRKTSASQSSCK